MNNPVETVKNQLAEMHVDIENVKNEFSQPQVQNTQGTNRVYNLQSKVSVNLTRVLRQTLNVEMIVIYEGGR